MVGMHYLGGFPCITMHYANLQGSCPTLGCITGPRGGGRWKLQETSAPTPASAPVPDPAAQLGSSATNYCTAKPGPVVPPGPHTDSAGADWARAN